MRGRTHVWLLDLGAPAGAPAARAWLKALLSDPEAVVPGLPAWLRGLWVWFLCWRSSPALEDRCGRAQGGDLDRELQARDLERILGPHYAVRPVQRYGEHTARDAVQEVGRHDRVVLLPTSAHVGGPTTISPLRAAHRALASHPAARAEVSGYPDHPGYVEAVAETLRESLLALPSQADPYEVIFCGRGWWGAPGPYPDQVQATVRALVHRSRLQRPHHLAWTRSPGGRSGPEPQVLDRVRERGQAGVRSLVLLPVGFSSESRQTRLELDQEAALVARDSGIEHFVRGPTVATRPTFLRCLADQVRAAEDRAGWDVPWRELPQAGGS